MASEINCAAAMARRLTSCGVSSGQIAEVERRTYLFFHPPRLPGAPPLERGEGPVERPECSCPPSRIDFGWKILLSIPGPISSRVGLRARDLVAAAARSSYAGRFAASPYFFLPA